MQHLHAQVTLDRARHARAPCAPAILGADRAGIASARHDRDVDDWMRTIKAGRDLRDDARSEEHTSELQSPCNLVCRLLLEKKKKKQRYQLHSTAQNLIGADK